MAWPTGSSSIQNRLNKKQDNWGYIIVIYRPIGLSEEWVNGSSNGSVIVDGSRVTRCMWALPAVMRVTRGWGCRVVEWCGLYVGQVTAARWPRASSTASCRQQQRATSHAEHQCGLPVTASARQTAGTRTGYAWQTQQSTYITLFLSLSLSLYLSLSFSLLSRDALDYAHHPIHQAGRSMW